MNAKRKDFCEIVLGVFASAIMLCSCGNLQEASVSSTYIPYSSETELSFYKAADSDIVNYKTMRTIALLELKESAEFFGLKTSDTLSEEPVAIMNISTNLPDYYEFQVLRSGEPVGYITTVANKNLGEPIQYISNEAKDYCELKVQGSAIRSGNTRIYNNGYPCTIAMKCPKVNERSLYEDSIAPRDIYISYLEGMTEEDFSEMKTTYEELLSIYDAECSADEERLNLLWNALFEEENEILAITDDEIEKAYSTKNRASLYENDGTWNCQFVTPWANLHYYNTCFYYCGPASLGIVLAGYENKEDCSDAINRLFNAGLKQEGAVYHPGMNKALKIASNNQLKLKDHGFHGFEAIWNDMAKSGMPVISLRVGTSLKNVTEASWHYRTIIGMGKKITERKQHKFGKKRWETYSYAKYYYCADNGSDATTSNLAGVFGYNSAGYKFWEISGSHGSYFQHFPVVSNTK